MAVTIEAVNYVVGRSKSSLPVTEGKKIKYLEVKLSNGISFDIEIDRDGDIVITGSGTIKVLSEQENEIIFNVEKSS